MEFFDVLSVPVKFLIAFVVALAAVWADTRCGGLGGGNLAAPGARGRQPRLAVIYARGTPSVRAQGSAPVDAIRWLGDRPALPARSGRHVLNLTPPQRADSVVGRRPAISPGAGAAH
jgi:hypothetical protein